MALSALLADDPTAACLTIDLPALQSNYRLIAERVSPAKASANIKADAYGLGIDVVVPALVEAGCSHFFVATISEGLSARISAPHATIYVLNSFSSDAAKAYEAHRLTAVLGSYEDIADFEKALEDRLDLLAPALHIDTGMNRLGLTIDEARSFAERRKSETSPLPFSLLMTHFIESEIHGSSITEKQVTLFDEMRRMFRMSPRVFRTRQVCFSIKPLRMTSCAPVMRFMAVIPAPIKPIRCALSYELKRRSFKFVTPKKEHPSAMVARSLLNVTHASRRFRLAMVMAIRAAQKTQIQKLVLNA